MTSRPCTRSGGASFNASACLVGAQWVRRCCGYWVFNRPCQDLYKNGDVRRWSCCYWIAYAIAELLLTYSTPLFMVVDDAVDLNGVVASAARLAGAVGALVSTAPPIRLALGQASSRLANPATVGTDDRRYRVNRALPRPVHRQQYRYRVRLPGADGERIQRLPVLRAVCPGVRHPGHADHVRIGGDSHKVCPCRISRRTRLLKTGNAAQIAIRLLRRPVLHDCVRVAMCPVRLPGCPPAVPGRPQEVPRPRRRCFAGCRRRVPVTSVQRSTHTYR